MGTNDSGGFFAKHGHQPPPPSEPTPAVATTAKDGEAGCGMLGFQGALSLFWFALNAWGVWVAFDEDPFISDARMRMLRVSLALNGMWMAGIVVSGMVRTMKAARHTVGARLWWAVTHVPMGLPQ